MAHYKNKYSPFYVLPLPTGGPIVPVVLLDGLSPPVVPSVVSVIPFFLLECLSLLDRPSCLFPFLFLL
jgi:hypothetical protein